MSPLSSCPIIFNFRSYVHSTKVQMPVEIWCSAYHLWPLGGQMRLSCVHSIKTGAFNQFSSHSNKICLGPRSRSQFWHPAVPFVTTSGPNRFVSCVRCKPQSFHLIFFKFTPYIPQTQALMPINFWRSAVPFLATIFFKFTHLLHLWPLGGPTSFFLFVLYTPSLSIDLFQSHTKCSLSHGLDQSTQLQP